VTNLLDGTFSGFTISGSGALNPMLGSPFTPGTRPSAAVVDASGKYLYVADLGNEIFGYTIDANTGTPTAITGSPFKGGSAPLFLIEDTTGKFLLTADESTATASEFSIDPKTGALATGGTFNTGVSPTSIAIVP
jgi:6-phosphogluconolactonase (cycloisomerase 2 family)